MREDEHVLMELFNHTKTPQVIFMEPWGDEISLPPKTLWNLVCEGTNADMISVDFHEEGIAIYGIPKVMMRIYAGEEIVWECFQPFDPPER